MKKEDEEAGKPLFFVHKGHTGLMTGGDGDRERFFRAYFRKSFPYERRLSGPFRAWGMREEKFFYQFVLNHQLAESFFVTTERLV